jgi:hypothetical protein
MKIFGITLLIIFALIDIAIFYYGGMIWGTAVLIVAVLLAGWDWLMSLFDPPKRR